MERLDPVRDPSFTSHMNYELQAGSRDEFLISRGISGINLAT